MAHPWSPFSVAGSCGTLKSGQQVRYADEPPLANLWISLLTRMDIKIAQLGDSTGGLKHLS